MLIMIMQGERDDCESFLIENWKDEELAKERCKIYNESANQINNHWIKAKIIDFNEWIPIEKPKMFYWEDFYLLEDRTIQTVLREVDAAILAKALVSADKNIKRKIFRNFSKRAAQMLLEDIEYSGPVSKKEVISKRKHIEDIVNHMIDAGTITFNKDDEMIIDDTEMTIDELFPNLKEKEEDTTSEKSFLNNFPNLNKKYKAWKEKLLELRSDLV